MNPEAYKELEIIISIISLLVTIVGLYAVYVQIKKVRESVWSNMHSKLCDQSFELLRLFSENPKTYDYFYHRKSLEEDEADRVFILYATEALANFLEHLVLQKPSLPAKQWEVWERFIYSTFGSSVIIKTFLQDHREWYSAELLNIADKIKVT